MRRLAMVAAAGMLFCAGCGGLRFGPGEAQKRNVWVHNRTCELAAQAADGKTGEQDG